MATSAADGASPQPRHPLDPLSTDELGRAARLALAHVGSAEPLRVVDVSLHEPEKAALLSGAPVGREAWVVMLDRRRGSTHELVVSLDTDVVVQLRELTDVQPAIVVSEWDECELMVRADPRFQEALRRRGVTNFDLVTVEAWGMGTHADPRHRDRRLAWTPCWVREDPDDNPYAHPIDGLYAIVDLNAMEIIEVEDHGVFPIPATSARARWTAPVGDRTAGGAQLRRLRVGGVVAVVAPAARVHGPRGPRPAPD